MIQIRILDKLYFNYVECKNLLYCHIYMFIIVFIIIICAQALQCVFYYKIIFKYISYKIRKNNCIHILFQN
jgi:hypothetical protein